MWVPAGVTHSARFDVEFCPVVLEGPPRTGTAPHDAPDDEPAARTVPVDPEQRAALLATRRDHTRTSRTLRTLLAAPGDSTTPGDPRPRAAARPGPAQDPGRLHGPLTAPIAQALAEDPASNLTLDEWAARLHVSPVSIRRAFLTETGVPFSRWRTRARLDIAVDRLRAGEPVTAVAHAVGLSHNGLLAACRRDLGLPPSALRPQPGTRTTPPA